MRRVGRILLLVLVVLIAYGVGVAQPYVLRPPLVAGQDAITDAASRAAIVTVEDVGGRLLSIQPTEPARVVFILYPGGLVRPQAYEWLGRALAARGVQTLIPEFPADLAVLDSGRAGALITRYAAGRPVVLGGHSLGGVMAASYAAEHLSAVSGLVFMASYPAQGTSLTSGTFTALSLLAERDGVADPAAIRTGLNQLPAGSRLVVIPGAVHSFFGRYGPQSGDGIPTVSRAEAEASIIDAIGTYLDAIR